MMLKGMVTETLARKYCRGWYKRAAVSAAKKRLSEVKMDMNTKGISR
jgi:hypothetical protein